MVFEGESSDDQSSLPYIHSSNSSTEGIYQVPASVEDPDYHGLDLDTMVFYEKHDKASMRHVAFEGPYIGRRFLACAEPENAELTKSKEKFTQEKLELKFQIADLLKGKEVHSEERGQLELQIAELMKGEEELKLKLKCILAILQK
ncbi:hypothetical protein ZWY2020_039999 [Hordeum vulgare]|nr:hypothetical protein ZWY2020_039999 [Hordeum vulgare]